ncbi:alpha/beta fold hydrolase [Candidatus Woesearchaeota archaeon]|nr:alpha/beta fold hydrolase [Candidatus Woesearchaeota archaeon]
MKNTTFVWIMAILLMLPLDSIAYQSSSSSYSTDLVLDGGGSANGSSYASSMVFGVGSDSQVASSSSYQTQLGFFTTIVLENGETCSANLDCAGGSCCSSVCTNLICTGASCSADAQCYGGYCCSGVCSNAACSLSLGNACTVSTQCGTGCCFGGVCQSASICASSGSGAGGGGDTGNGNGQTQPPPTQTITPPPPENQPGPQPTPTTVTEQTNLFVLATKRNAPKSSITCSEDTQVRNVTVQTNVSRQKLLDAILKQGYEVIVPAFAVDCVNTEQVSFNVPDYYTDVKILRCTGSSCSAEVVEQQQQIRCGKKVSYEAVATGFNETVFTEGSFLTPTKTTSDEVLNTSGYIIRMSSYQPFLLVKDTQLVEELQNPAYRLVSDPIALDFDAPAQGTLNITIPYVAESNIPAERMFVSILTAHGFERMPTIVNTQSHTLSFSIANVIPYLSTGDKLRMLALGETCKDCMVTSFHEVYHSPHDALATIILVHGFGSSSATFQDIIDDFNATDQPYNVFAFSYTSNSTVEATGKELAEQLEAHAKDMQRIYLVGHSLGGIVVQQALHYADEQNKEHYTFTFLGKTKKVLLAGSPNLGLVDKDSYQWLYQYFINLKSNTALFTPESGMVQQIVDGVVTPRVKGIEYGVIAGTRPYALDIKYASLKSNLLSNTTALNDGLVAVRSAQRIGDMYYNNSCTNYWQIDVDHNNLIKHPLARKVIEQAIAKDVSADATTTTPLAGLNHYYGFTVTCSEDSTYYLIGKKLQPSKVFDELGCNCGNGWCGEGENKVNCPADCASLWTEGNFCLVLYPTEVAFGFIIFLTTLSTLVIFVRYGKAKIRNVQLRWLLIAALLITVTLVVMLWPPEEVCNSYPESIYLVTFINIFIVAVALIARWIIVKRYKDVLEHPEKVLTQEKQETYYAKDIAKADVSDEAKLRQPPVPSDEFMDSRSSTKKVSPKTAKPLPRKNRKV